MERVWDELRKIESKAEHIHSETLKKSEELLAVAEKDAEKLLSVSKEHTKVEADKLFDTYLKKASKDRDATLEENKRFINDLRTSVKKSFDEAVTKVFDAVLGKIKV
jgi:vacuolar-type H+-ATPase subunit H